MSNKVKLTTRRHAFSKLTINQNSQDQKVQISPVGQKSKLQGVVKITPVKKYFTTYLIDRQPIFLIRSSCDF